MKRKANAKSARRNTARKGHGARKVRRSKIRFIDLFAGIGGVENLLAEGRCVEIDGSIRRPIWHPPF